MSQLLRDDPDIHAFLAELGDVGVAQAVGMNTLGDTGTAAEERQPAAHVARGEALARVLLHRSNAERSRR